ncbi:FecCD family ABC transporter permease [Thermosulfidibacter takaii]|uniref:FecCD family ABC transporter permease n=1 Tax=Thermosulfidibacter takaii TaxID=412593 RepID=UPI000838B6AC|nr:iron ABC transporter permease [Thermosulfidibacter takaii]
MRWLLWIVILVVVFLFSLIAGSVWINPFHINPESVDILINLRLPRAFMAFLVGGMLALSGTLYQQLLRNPLADGFTTGAASCCALGAVLAISLGLPALAVGLFALVFGMVGFWLVYLLSMRGSYVEPVTMILAGIVLNIVASSFISFMKFLNEESVLSVVFWLMGSLEFVGWGKVLIELAIFVLSLLVVLRYSYALDVMALDDVSAFSTGVNVNFLRKYLFFWATLLVAFSVAFTGVIAFVGLIVPHAVRALVGARSRNVLVFSALGGGTLLMVADAVSRSLLVGGGEMPVGVITSLTGGGFFLYLLFRRKKEVWYV